MSLLMTIQKVDWKENKCRETRIKPTHLPPTKKKKKKKQRMKDKKKERKKERKRERERERIKIQIKNMIKTNVIIFFLIG